MCEVKTQGSHMCTPTSVDLEAGKPLSKRVRMILEKEIHGKIPSLCNTMQNYLWTPLKEISAQ